MEHKPLLMGYWNNDRNGRYDRPQDEGEAANLDLIEIPEEYNVIVVSTPYMDKEGHPIFEAHNKSNGVFRDQVENLTSKGRQVLFNLDGQYVNRLYRLNYSENQLAVIIRSILDGNGFNGICIDLDREMMDETDNRVVIPEALKLLKDWYKERDEDFSICISSYFFDLGEENKSFPYLVALEGHCDLVCANLYDQYITGAGNVSHSIRFNEGRDWRNLNSEGVDEGEDLISEGVDEGRDWISEDDDEQKEDFLYGMMDSLTNRVPHDKLVLGLPANQNAVHKGYVKDPSAVLNAMERLKQSGRPIRGLSAYSINWDAGHDKDGQPYSHEFIKRYKGIITPV
ncbi:chitinase [Priestia aryabhattai]|uniref:chitinase n=1 Tax=Priestia aryabhattai TaxID=412384 RepID=UPI0028817F24|nr:chitinase [Priestia aryabhattai]MDT0150200.1 chitinase [Priestia aryabhattai]MDT0155772.1 chitinase [Priestia aryabhattai]